MLALLGQNEGETHKEHGFMETSTSWAIGMIQESFFRICQCNVAQAGEEHGCLWGPEAVVRTFPTECCECGGH